MDDVVPSFREVMVRPATGAAIVTATWQGESYGLAVNSLTSVSVRRATGDETEDHMQSSNGEGIPGRSTCRTSTSRPAGSSTAASWSGCTSWWTR